MPSRPKLISLPSTTEPGEFQMLTPLPRSLIWPSCRPSMRLRRTIAALGPFRLTPIRLSSSRLPSITAPAARAVTKMPLSSTERSLPEPVTVSPRSTTSRRIDGDHAPDPAAVEHRAWLAFERQCAVDDDRPGVAAGHQHQPIAGRRGGDGRGQPTGLGGDLDRRRCGAGRRQQCGEHDAAVDRPSWHVRQALLGSTSIRPFISMCMAWQNHWQ